MFVQSQTNILIEMALTRVLTNRCSALSYMCILEACIVNIRTERQLLMFIRDRQMTKLPVPSQNGATAAVRCDMVLHQAFRDT